MNSRRRTPNPPVSQTLSGKKILLTGATGFLGKVFLEKLLRTCPAVEMVYLLVRAPSYIDAEDRLENEILSSTLFTNSSAQFIRRRLRALPGDTTLPRFGVSAEEYLLLLSEVDLVVNAAASTDFMEALSLGIRSNTVSVQNIIEFMRQSDRARLLHISTCYVNETGDGVAHEMECAQPAHAVCRLPDSSEEIFARLNAELEKSDVNEVEAGQRFAARHGWNNVYTFSKWLGEKLLRENIPCTILRPSIIESCIQDPIPGWIEGFKVADPLFYRCGTDRVKFFPGNPAAILDIIPADMVASAMMLCLNELAIGEARTRIYHASTSAENPITLDSLTGIVRGAYGRSHIKRPFVIPSWIFFAFMSLVVWLQRAFAQRSTVRNTERLLSLAKLYEPYTSLRRTYDSRKLKALFARASSSDRKIFSVDTSRIDWTDYLTNTHVPGLQKFVLAQRSKT